MVRGNTSSIPATHPVIEAVMKRYAEGSLPGSRGPQDKYKIALAVEGGGMRGCVAAGSSAALQFLGLENSVDAVYGASAGSMVAAYFISRQSAGVQIYHDILTSAGRAFINKTKLLAAVGFANPFPASKPSNKSPLSGGTNSGSGPAETNVFNLDFLLEEIMGRSQPLDWEAFARNDAHQPLHVVTSSLESLEAVTFSSSRRGFGYADMGALLHCIRASMNVPGITGALVGIPKDTHNPVPGPLAPPEQPTPGGGMRLRGGIEGERGRKYPTPASAPASAASPHEALVDAFLVEPIPYRSACKDGATHVIVLRTRPDPCPVLGNKGPGLFERVICRRFFDANGQPGAGDWVEQLRHQLVYAEDVVRLNDGARGRPEGVVIEGRPVHMLPIAPSAGCPEVGQLEVRRAKILAGMRDGARRTLQLFLPAILAQQTRQQAPSDGIDGSSSGHFADSAEQIEQIEQMVRMMLPDDILGRSTTLEDYRATYTVQRGADIC